MADINAIAKQFTGQPNHLHRTSLGVELELRERALTCVPPSPDYYYNTFDGERSGLANLYVSLMQ